MLKKVVLVITHSLDSSLKFFPTSCSPRAFNGDTISSSSDGQPLGGLNRIKTDNKRPLAPLPSSLPPLPPPHLLLRHRLPLHLPPHHQPIPPPSHTTFSLLKSHNDIDPKTVLLLLIAYVVFVTVFNLLSIGSITYSVFQGFYGRPVKLISAVKSSFTSFFPLLATLVSSNSIVFLILLILGLASFSLTRVIELIVPGLELYGMESVSLSMIVVFSIAQSSLVWISNVTASDIENGGKLWTNAVFVVQIVVTSALLTGLMMYYLAGTTVMYMYCKAVQGKLVWEIAEEFAREFVSLPFDDGKVPHVVSVAYNG
ncbi:hypothetical protein YC2023_019408 [Brassica napus]